MAHEVLLAIGCAPPSAAIIAEHYGPAFAADCYYDSECLRNLTAGPGPSELGGLNSRSWRFQKCSELAYLQRAPARASISEPSVHNSSTRQSEGGMTE